ncbi:toxin-antitoxin system HicB family antitoxin [Methylomonas sp. EFPC3]|nr:toxin-antitoxin system HicB family antitoxin [Methylomonas sp. EFPC3]WFP49817.1 toxin-antitoxin system HicB family antitoxin [Methylomonas sp. EFPC3]
MLRIPPEIHTAALLAAKAKGKSLNQWATEVLMKRRLFNIVQS